MGLLILSKGTSKKIVLGTENQGDKQILLVAMLFFLVCFAIHFEVMKQFVTLERLSAKFNIGRGR